MSLVLIDTAVFNSCSQRDLQWSYLRITLDRQQCCSWNEFKCVIQLWILDPFPGVSTKAAKASLNQGFQVGNGKAVKGSLAWVLYQVVGKNWFKAFFTAASLELLHKFFLIQQKIFFCNHFCQSSMDLEPINKVFVSTPKHNLWRSITGPITAIQHW